MTDQASLFDAFPTPSARLTDPVTSHMAAVVAIGAAQTGRRLALAALCEANRPLSDFDLEAVTGVRQTSIGKRRGDLVTAKLVTQAFLVDPESCERVPLFGTSPSGARCLVWEPTPAGREVHANWLRALEGP